MSDMHRDAQPIIPPDLRQKAAQAGEFSR